MKSFRPSAFKSPFSSAIGILDFSTNGLTSSGIITDSCANPATGTRSNERMKSRFAKVLSNISDETEVLSGFAQELSSLFHVIETDPTSIYKSLRRSRSASGHIAHVERADVFFPAVDTFL